MALYRGVFFKITLSHIFAIFSEFFAVVFAVPIGNFPHAYFTVIGHSVPYTWTVTSQWDRKNIAKLQISYPDSKIQIFPNPDII